MLCESIVAFLVCVVSMHKISMCDEAVNVESISTFLKRKCPCPTYDMMMKSDIFHMWTGSVYAYKTHTHAYTHTSKSR